MIIHSITVMVDNLVSIMNILIYNMVVYVIMLLNNNWISLITPLLRLPIILSIIMPQILKISLYLIHLVHQIYLVVNVILS